MLSKYNYLSFIFVNFNDTIKANVNIEKKVAPKFQKSVTEKNITRLSRDTTTIKTKFFLILDYPI